MIRDGAGNELRSTIGPYNEGSTLALVCVVYGGKLPTKIFRDEFLVRRLDGELCIAMTIRAMYE